VDFDFFGRIFGILFPIVGFDKRDFKGDILYNRSLLIVTYYSALSKEVKYIIIFYKTK